MVSQQPRFLVLRGGSIGDFILTLPALQALRARWPDAYIELLGYPHIAELAQAGGLVDRVASLDKAGVARFFSLRPTFSQDQINYIRSFDLIISYLHDPEGVVRENLLQAGARQVIYGSPIVESGHAIEHLLKPLEELALYAERDYPRLALRPEHMEKGRTLLSKLVAGSNVIAVHPGSGSPTKNWPLARFIELCREISKRDLGSPLISLGEADAAIAATLHDASPGFPALTGCSLLELAGVLSQCKLYIGNDSGVTHLAASLGIPVVALFGPSDPSRYGPRGQHVKIVQAPSGNLESLTVSDVLTCLF